MFQTIMQQQGQALENLMAKQPTQNPHLMNEARADLQSAISKAVRAIEDSPQTVTSA